MKIVKSRFDDLEWGRNGERNDGRRIRRVGWWKSVIETVKEGKGNSFGRT